MINIAKQSKLTPQAVSKKAREFFGPGGLGLSVATGDDDNIHFEGGGGFVDVEAKPEPHGSAVTVMSQEWDYQAKQFLEKV